MYASKDIRNAAIVGHGTCGKTTLGEAMLFSAGATSRRGSVDEGNSILDYEEEEIEKKMSISGAVAFIEHDGCKINFIDTPGFADFDGEVASATRVIETSVIVVHATSGLEVGTEKAWRRSASRDKSRVLFLNQMDREHADYDKILASMRERWGSGVVPVTIPIGVGSKFQGVVDVLRQRAYLSDDGKITEADVPAELKDAMEAAHEVLVDVAAEADDELLEKYFESGELSREELLMGLRQGVAKGKIFPLICGAASQMSGVRQLLDVLVGLSPSPLEGGVFAGVDEDGEECTESIDVNGPPVALVFKTHVERHVGELAYVRVFSGRIECGDEVRNLNSESGERIGHMAVLRGKEKEEVSELVTGDIAALVKLKHTGTGDTLAGSEVKRKALPPNFPPSVIAQAIKAVSKADEDKIGSALNRMRREDPTFRVAVDPELHQTVIYGMGEVHLDMVVKRLSHRYGVEVETLEPRIPFRETIKGRAEAHYRHKKQSGGRGQFADVNIRLEGRARGEGYEFVDAIVGGAIPNKFIPAVDKGINELLPEGVLAGYPLIDIRVTLYDGGFHAVDSSEMAFKIAARQAFRSAFMDAKPVLLEPINELAVTIPESDLGPVMGDLTQRRGRTQGMEPDGAFTTVKALVPVAELYRYSTQLRSLTGGRGIFTSTFSHYEEVPGDVAPKVIESAKAAKAALEA